MNKITGNHESLYSDLLTRWPEAGPAIERVRQQVWWSKRQIDNHRQRQPWQSAALYGLAKEYNRADCVILEIGTALGYSAAIMAEAAPKASIITLNPKPGEYEQAQENLKGYLNVSALKMKSWDYERIHPIEQYDMVFVDGDHQQVERDFVFWDHLKPEGLILFHDYSPSGSSRPCREVYEAINEFQQTVGEIAILIMDEKEIGIAGFYKR